MASRHCSGPWKKSGWGVLKRGCLPYDDSNMFTFCWGLESEGVACPVRSISIALGEEWASVRNGVRSISCTGQAQLATCSQASASCTLWYAFLWFYIPKKLCYWAYCQFYDECPTCFFPNPAKLLDMIAEFPIDRTWYPLKFQKHTPLDHTPICFCP